MKGAVDPKNRIVDEKTQFMFSYLQKAFHVWDINCQYP